ncbi:MAG: hypothetical protein ACM3US_12240 [Sphingomonadaceae bacterium]
MLPPALEAFSRLPFWNALFLLLSIAIVVYCGWALARRRRRQDLYYLLLGVYLTGFQLLVAVPSLGFHPSQAAFPLRFALALPPVALFVLGVRAR